MNILAMLWGKTAAIVVGAVSLLAMLLGIRHSIRKGAKDEMSNEIRERTLEQIARGDEIDKEIAGLSDGDVIARMRKRGEVRD